MENSALQQCSATKMDVNWLDSDLLLFLFPSKCPELDHFDLQTLGINQDQLPGLIEFGNRQYAHTLC